MTTIKCRTCEKEFDVKPGEIRQRDPKYCSVECYRASRRGKPSPRRGRKFPGYGEPKPTKRCEICDKDFVLPYRSKRQRFCSRDCLYKWLRGPSSPSWKGGRVMSQEGYVLVYRPDHRDAKNQKGYVKEHRLVMEQHLGRPLGRSEAVHHINGDKADNRIENLQLRQGKHGTGVVHVCLDCGSHNIGTEEVK